MQGRISLPLLLSFGFLIALSGACATNSSFPQPMTVDIPPGLGQQHIETMVISGLLNKPAPYRYDPRVEIAPEEYEKTISEAYLLRPDSRGWVIENREPGLITATLSRPARYLLRIHVAFDNSVVGLSIVDSRGLNQTETQIHHKAVGWLRKAQLRIHNKFYVEEIE